MDPAQVPIPPPPPSAPDQAAIPGTGMICPQCHFPAKPEYYYCPNCGKALREAPLSTSAGTQLLIYAWSIILPSIAFISVSRWPGMKYFKSGDPKAQQIGLVAIILLALSTIVTYWLAIVWLQSYVKQSVNDVNNLGSLGGY